MKEWEKEEDFLSWEYHYSLIDFKKHIHLLFETIKKNITSLTTY